MKKMRAKSDTAQNNFVWTKVCNCIPLVCMGQHELKMDKQDLPTGKS